MPICFSFYYCLGCSMLLESVVFYLALILEKSQHFSSNIFSLLFSLLLSHSLPLPSAPHPSLLLPFPLSSSPPSWGSNYVFFRQLDIIPQLSVLFSFTLSSYLHFHNFYLPGFHFYLFSLLYPVKLFIFNVSFSISVCPFIVSNFLLKQLICSTCLLFQLNLLKCLTSL